jgi:Fur family peroxide stress response transcriptional regulator
MQTFEVSLIRIILNWGLDRLGFGGILRLHLMKKPLTPASPAYESAMGRDGLRLTPQRRQVYEVLMHKRDHPTATEVFLRVQKRMPSISLATVYNCLETMVGNGLVKEVHVDREPTRFCANLQEHGHFHCTECGHITDIEFSESTTLKTPQSWTLPSGFYVTQQDVTLRGLCPDCGANASPTPFHKHSTK